MSKTKDYLLNAGFCVFLQSCPMPDNFPGN